MKPKTAISEKDFPKILSNYDLGKYKTFETFNNGAGQTTLLLLTTKGKFVLKYYKNRSRNHVQFEVQLLNFLRSKNYPVPTIIKNSSGEFSAEYHEKPYIIFEFMDGKPGKNPNNNFDKKESSEVIKAVAQLHNLTENYNPEYFKNRETFDAKYCWKEFQNRNKEVSNLEKWIWFKNELSGLEFPNSLPKGLCHADLNYGNFLFKNGKFIAVLDFDMSFYFYPIYDIASLICWWAWPPQESFKETRAIYIVEEYLKCRNLTMVEKTHIFDAIKLIILLDVSWSEENEYEVERKAIEFLNSLGREKFYNLLFLEKVMPKEMTELKAFKIYQDKAKIQEIQKTDKFIQQILPSDPPFYNHNLQDSLRTIVQAIVPNRPWKIPNHNTIWLELIDEDEAKRIKSHFEKNGYEAIQHGHRKDAPAISVIVLRNVDFDKLIQVPKIDSMAQKMYSKLL